MEDSKWYMKLVILLVMLSIAAYSAQFMLFHNARDTIFYLFQDIAFVPLNALIVMLILDKLLKKKEKENLLHKMNMVIGIFFNEIGNDFLNNTKNNIENNSSSAGIFNDLTQWDNNKYSEVIKNFKSLHLEIKLTDRFLNELRLFLLSKKDTLLALLENPNLLEHEKFTDLLWAIFHVTDELAHRKSFVNLPESDITHLKGDLTRAYNLLIIEWLSYMKHLKLDYPYLYSIAVRTNPFSDANDIIVK